MEIKKFESLKYKGPNLMNVKRKDIMSIISDIFIDADIFDYQCTSASFDGETEILYLYLYKDSDNDNKVLKLDLSDISIEIGNIPIDEETEEYLDFVSNVNLDTNITKQLKNYKTNIKKFSI